MTTTTDKKHWPDCAANFGRDCDMGEDCGGPEVLKEIDDLIEHVEENVGVIYGGDREPELTGKEDTIEGLRELRLKVRDLVQGTTPVDGDEPPGLFRKYRVQRLNDPAGKHDACDYFVIDRVHDRFAAPALVAYADACQGEHPQLAADLRADPRLVDYLAAQRASAPGGEAAIKDLRAELETDYPRESGSGTRVVECSVDRLDALLAEVLQLRADRKQLAATLLKEREERLLPGSPADAADVARRLVDSFADNYRCDACNARASMPEDNKADAVRALTPILIAWLRVHGPIQIPDDPEQRDTLRASIAFDLTDTSGERRMVECDRARLDELLTRCIALQHRHDEMEDVFLSNGMPEGEPHPDAWLAARNQALRAEQEAKRAEREATFKPFTCAYCDVREKTKEEIAAHIAGCEKHPLRAAEARIAELEARIAGASNPLTIVAELKEAPRPRFSFHDWLRVCGVFRDDGSFDVKQATKELADYYEILGEVPAVYTAISGGRLSKPTYTAEVMIGQFEDEVQRRCETAVADAREVWEAEHVAASRAPLPPPTNTGPVPIAPGIARTVALLRSWGFETTDSGDGVTNVEAGVEGARDYPHVAMVVPQHENLTNIAALLQSRLRGIGIELQPVGTDGPCLQASYDPASGVAILDLMNVHDGMLPPESASSQEGR